MSNYKLDPIEDIIEAAQNGEMFILVDDEHRENEGDLVIPAQKATPEAINFMAIHGRGLICLALDSEIINRLQLPSMVARNESRHKTAFTVSIEASEGITTGISAHDRCHTILTAVANNSSAADICSPGHIFPLAARDGGVLVRAGHTEAAVDLARLAKLKPAGVICEIMKNDGTMARLPDLIEFAKQHNLKIGTIADLISYRRLREKIIEKICEAEITYHPYGKFTTAIYRNKIAYAEHIVLIKGDIAEQSRKNQPIHIRMHALNPFQDILNADFNINNNISQNKNTQSRAIDRAMAKITEIGSGVIVLLREPDATQASKIIHNISNHKNRQRPHMDTLKDYGIGAQILVDLDIKNMVLLSNNPNKAPVGLDGYGLNIIGYETF